MNYTYKIIGMSCNGCKSHVEEALTEIEDVINVTVNLEKAEAIISTTKSVDFQTLKNAVESAGNYSIHPKDEEVFEKKKKKKSLNK